MTAEMKKVIGFGGVFFKSKDPKALGAWYKEHLGLPVEQWGTMFDLSKTLEANKGAYNIWSPFSQDTKYLEPSDKPFMFNFIVADLEALVRELKSEGIMPLKEIEASEYGKFCAILDPENNKVELWEPPKGE